MMNAGPMARFRELVTDATLMDQIVQRVAEEGETLKGLAKLWQVPYGALSQWIIEDRERSEMYSRALRFAAETFVHEIVPIADGKNGSGALNDPAARKLQVEARKWVAGKWDRGRYGDSHEIKHSGSVSLVAVLAGLPRTSRTLEHEDASLLGREVKVLGAAAPAQGTPEHGTPAVKNSEPVLTI